MTFEVLDGSLPVILLGSGFGVKPMSLWSLDAWEGTGQGGDRPGRRQASERQASEASEAVLLQV